MQEVGYIQTNLVFPLHPFFATLKSNQTLTLQSWNENTYKQRELNVYMLNKHKETTVQLNGMLEQTC